MWHSQQRVFLLKALECVKIAPVKIWQRKRDEVVSDDAAVWLIQTDSELLPYSKGSAVRGIHLVTPLISADSLLFVMAGPPWEGCQLGYWHTSLRTASDVKFLIIQPSVIEQKCTQCTFNHQWIFSVCMSPLHSLKGKQATWPQVNSNLHVTASKLLKQSDFLRFSLFNFSFNILIWQKKM